MNACEQIQPQLSAYVDGALDAASRAVVHAHVLECARCRGIVADFGQLLQVSRQLGPVAPPEHLWLEVAGQVRLSDHERPAPVMAPRTSNPWLQWAGLTAALLGITVIVYFFAGVTPAPAPERAATTITAPAGTVDAVNEELDLAVHHYERAIAELEAVAGNDTSIDPEIALAVRDSISTIDLAISESRVALTSSPESEPARISLFEALRQKINVLQATVTLINEMRQGDPEGASRAAEGLGRES